MAPMAERSARPAAAIREVSAPLPQARRFLLRRTGGLHRPHAAGDRPQTPLGRRPGVPRPGRRHQPHPRAERHRDGHSPRPEAGGVAGVPQRRPSLHAARRAGDAVLAWAYVRYGSLPRVGWVLYGIKPVVIAIVLLALWDLGKKAVKGVVTALVGAAVLGLYLVGVNEILLLFAGAAVVLAVFAIRRYGWKAASGIAALPLLKVPMVTGRGARRVQPARSVPIVPQDRRGALRQRLRPAGVLEVRVRHAARLADQPAASRRHRRRPGDARAGVQQRHVRRLPAGELAGGSAGHAGHLPAVVCLRRRCCSVSCHGRGSHPGRGRSWTA